MKKATLFPALLLILACLTCTGCGRRERFSPPPDLRGSWIQEGWENSNYYHIATITDDEIIIHWFTPEDQSLDLYWAGTYVPPVTDREPYRWTSENRREEHKDRSRFTLVDETKDFIFKNEAILFDVMIGHIKMNTALVRLPPAKPSENSSETSADALPGVPSAPVQEGTETVTAPAVTAPIVTAPIGGGIQPIPQQRTSPPEAPPNQLP